MNHRILKTLGYIGVFLLSMSAVTGAAESSGACPERGFGETELDCPWAGIARRLQNLNRNPEELSKVFNEQAPGLVKQLKSDAPLSELKNLWGTSINYDENAKGTIVDHAILTEIARLIQIPLQGAETKLAHAGMEHTYGYLFSTLQTPFGYKRARWVAGEIEKGLEIPAGLIGPNPSEGTLLLNVTALTGKFAFRGDKNEQEELQKFARIIPKAIRELKASDYKVSRLEEKLQVPNLNGKSRPVTLKTDFVEFKTVQPDGNSHLLVYSVNDPFHHEAQLITAFPVKASFVERALASDGLGENKNITTRYNAYVDGLTGKTLKGTRSARVK